MKFVLCVLSALSACCDEMQLWFQDQACALTAWGNAPESSCFALSMLDMAPAATVLVVLFYIGMVAFFSTISPLGFEAAG